MASAVLLGARASSGAAAPFVACASHHPRNWRLDSSVFIGHNLLCQSSSFGADMTTNLFANDGPSRRPSDERIGAVASVTPIAMFGAWIAISGWSGTPGGFLVAATQIALGAVAAGWIVGGRMGRSIPGTVVGLVAYGLGRAARPAAAPGRRITRDQDPNRSEVGFRGSVRSSAAKDQNRTERRTRQPRKTGNPKSTLHLAPVRGDSLRTARRREHGERRAPGRRRQSGTPR